MNTRTQYRIPIAVALLLFSTLYWYAAFTKPFHVDEYYSWVYAERCSFREILCLKDHGIGHPPLYHLLQKAVQRALPFPHPAMVRLVNYFCGILFIGVLVPALLQRQSPPTFCYAVAASAAVLDLFVFSRMWGLVCLIALLLLLAGERFRHRPSRRSLALFLLAFFLGLLADYLFITLFPFVLIVLFARTRCFRQMAWSLGAVIGCGWLAAVTLYLKRGGKSLGGFTFTLLSGLSGILHATGVAVLNFWFEEPLIIAVLLILIACLLHLRGPFAARQPGGRTPYQAMIVSGLLILPPYLIKIDLLRMRYAVPMMLLPLTLLLGKSCQRKLINLDTFNGRAVASILSIFASIIAIHPLFRRELVEPRFLCVALPFVLLLLVSNYDRFVLGAVSLGLLVSGLLYLFSSGVSDYYPPCRVSQNMPVVFQDEYAYATQYFGAYRAGSGQPPLFIEPKFDLYCRVCRMGSSGTPYGKFDRFALVADAHYPFSSLPADYSLANQSDCSLRPLDRFLLRHFTAVYDCHYYMLYVFERRPPGAAPAPRASDTGIHRPRGPEGHGEPSSFRESRGITARHGRAM